MAANVKVEGIPETIARLKRAGDAFAVPKVKLVLVKGAQVFRDEIARRWPVKSGMSRQALIAKQGKGYNRASAFTAFDWSKLTKVNIRGKKILYPFMLEKGTKAHVIQGVRRTFLLVGSLGFFRKVQHPGTKGLGLFRKSVRNRRKVVAVQIERDLKQIGDQL